MTTITIKGGKALLVLGDGAVAHLTNNDDTKMFCVSTTDAKLVYNRHPVGAVFTNGAASELPPLWVLPELQFLGLKLQQKRTKPREASKPGWARPVPYRTHTKYVKPRRISPARKASYRTRQRRS